MGAKEDWKANRRARRSAKPPVYPLPLDQIDSRFAAMDGRLMFYFPERELDFATLGNVLARAEISNVRELWIDSDQTLDDHSLSLILAAPLEKLEVLGLRGWKLNDSALQAILDAPALAGIVELVLSPGSGNTIPWSSLRLCPRVPSTFATAARLQRLSFGFRCSARVAGTIATHPALAALQTLELLGTGMTDADVAILAAARNLLNLRSLNLSLNQIGVAGAAALAAAHWPTLEKLELVGNHLGAEGMQALGARTGLPLLRELSLASNGLPAIEWEVKVSGMSEEDKQQWRSDNRGSEPPTQDYIDRRAVSSWEIAERYFPGQSVKIS